MNKILFIILIILFNFQVVVAQYTANDSVYSDITIRSMQLSQNNTKFEKKIIRKNTDHKFKQLDFLRIYNLQFNNKFYQMFYSNKISFDTISGCDLISYFNTQNLSWSNTYLFNDTLLLGVATNRVIFNKRKKNKYITKSYLDYDEIKTLKALMKFKGEIYLQIRFCRLEYLILKNNKFYVMTTNFIEDKSCQTVNNYNFYLLCELKPEEIRAFIE